MTTNVTLDPSTGNTMHVSEHRVLVSWLDDAAYLGLMVYVYDRTGFNRFFLPLPELMFSNPVIVQALRYGLLFGSMLELRRWLQSMGIHTELFSYYVEQITRQLL